MAAHALDAPGLVYHESAFLSPDRLYGTALQALLASRASVPGDLELQPDKGSDHLSDGTRYHPQFPVRRQDEIFQPPPIMIPANGDLCERSCPCASFIRDPDRVDLSLSETYYAGEDGVYRHGIGTCGEKAQFAGFSRARAVPLHRQNAVDYRQGRRYQSIQLDKHAGEFVRLRKDLMKL